MNTRIISFSVVLTVSLSSCSLPPGQAWQQIQRDGLVAFIMSERSDDAPSNTSPLASETRMLAQVPSSQPPLSSDATQVGPAIPPIPPIQLAGPTAAPKTPTAPLAEGMVGYVRSPHTNPGRLVDVRGMSPGSKVVCPYTQKPFIVPSPAPLVADKPAAPQKPTPSTPLVSETKPRPTPKPEPSVAATEPKPRPAPQPEPSVAATEPKPTPPPSSSSPSVEPKPTPQVAANPIAPVQTTPAPAPKVEPASSLPFGMPIPGRPGFVNSPFAEKHQLVDVTGLAVGTEVKCPYSGKLFRVPPQQQAKN